MNYFQNLWPNYAMDRNQLKIFWKCTKNEHSGQVSSNLAQWFQRQWLKSGRRTDVWSLAYTNSLINLYPLTTDRPLVRFYVMSSTRCSYYLCQVRFCVLSGKKWSIGQNTWVHIRQTFRNSVRIFSTLLTLCIVKLNCNFMLPLQIFIVPNIFFKDISCFT